MADRNQISVRVAFVSEGTKLVERDISNVSNQIDRLNEITSSTFSQELKELESKIDQFTKILENIEKKIELRERLKTSTENTLARERTDLKSLENKFREVQFKIGAEIFEDIFDAINLIKNRSPSGNQVDDFLRGADPRNRLNEINVALALVEVLNEFNTKTTGQNALKTNRMPFVNTELTSAQQEGFQQSVIDAEKRLSELDKEIKEQVDQRIERQFPTIFEAIETLRAIKSKREQINKLESLIAEDEAAINSDKQLLQDVLNLLDSLEQKQDDLRNIEPPDIKFEINEDDVEGKLEGVKDALENYNGEIETGKNLVPLYKDQLDILNGAIAMANGGIVAGAGVQSEFAIEAEKTTEKIGQQLDQINNTDASLQGLVSQNAAVVNSEEQVKKSVEGASASMENGADSAEGFGDALEQVESSGGFFQGIKDGFKQFVESVGSSTELIADFFANTLSQMSQNFSDLFFNVITGKFDNLKDLAKQAFEAILKSFLDLVSAMATRQIVISIAGLFGASTKGAKATDILGGAGDLLGKIPGLGGLFGGGEAAASTLPAAIPGSSLVGGGLGGAGIAGSAIAAGGAGAGTVPVGASALLGIQAAPVAPTGFLAAVGGAIPVIGAVLAATAIAAPFIISALKKTPRLDLDFDTFRDDFGKSTGEAAKVMDFLNEDLFNNEIFSKSVARKAGLGLGTDGLSKVIREAIEGQITAIQQIIFQLPADLAAQLNESLLNTDIDITSKVKGDRLLEFDETKNIAEKFKQFIEGDLQARFIFAIRDFFVGAFDSLGAIPEAAQSFVDEQFEEFQNLKGREAEVVSLEEVRKEKNKNIGCLEEHRLAA